MREFPNDYSEWDVECIKYHGKLLKGKFSHWCGDWDDLPIDETCQEFEVCTCGHPEVEEVEFIQEKLANERLSRFSEEFNPGDI